MAKKVLITGGTGFVGYHLTEALLERRRNSGAENSGGELETEIYVTSYSDASEFTWYEEIGGESHVIKVDLTDADATIKMLAELRPDEIYHLASMAQVGSSFNQARGVLENNFDLQLNLLEGVAEACPDARVLVVSSGAVYDVTKSPTVEIDENCVIGPANPYAASKAIQDLMAYAYSQAQKLKIIRVRPFNHIGDQQGLGFAVPDFAKQIAEIAVSGETSGKIVVGNLTPKRDFTDVKDVVQAYVLLMENGEAGEVYNVGSGISHSMQEMLEMLVELSGTEVEIEVDQKLVRPVEIMDIVANNTKLRALGWEPKIPLRETLKRVLGYWEKRVK